MTRHGERLIEKLPKIEGNTTPTAIVDSDGFLQISAEHGDGLADYYGEFRGGYPWIHPELEAWAERHGCFIEWQDPGTLKVYPI